MIARFSERFSTRLHIIQRSITDELRLVDIGKSVLLQSVMSIVMQAEMQASFWMQDVGTEMEVGSDKFP